MKLETKNIKNLLQNIALAMGGIVLFLAVVEFGIRADPSNFFIYNTPLYREDQDLNFVLQPNQNFTFRRPEYVTSFRTNSHGFRDTQWDFIKDSKKIFFLGDSFTMGQGVEENERFANLIKSEYPGYDYLNFGLMGYSTIEQLNTLRRYGPQFQPKIVVLAFHSSDLFENYLHPVYEPSDGLLIFNQTKTTRLPRPFNKLLSKSATFKALLFHFPETFYALILPKKYQLAHRLTMTSNLNKPEYLAKLEPILVDTFRVISEIKKKCVQLKAELLVFIIPSDFDKKFLEKRFSVYGDKHGFHFIPTLDRFIGKIEKHKPRSLVYKRDGHLTAMGHKVLFEVLMESDLFSSSLPTFFHPSKLKMPLKTSLLSAVP